MISAKVLHGKRLPSFLHFIQHLGSLPSLCFLRCQLVRTCHPHYHVGKGQTKHKIGRGKEKIAHIQTIYKRNVPIWLPTMHSNIMKSVEFSNSWSGLENHLKGVHCHSASVHEKDLPSIESVKDLSENTITGLWRRFSLMSIEEMLLIPDYLFKEGYHSKLYTEAMIAYIYQNMEAIHLSPLQLVRLLFHTQFLKSPTSLFLVELEDKVEECLSQFEINHLAYVCYIFFHKQHRVRSMCLVDKIAEKLLQDFDLLSPDNITMFMKTFRYSNYIKVSFYKQFGDILVSRNYLKNFTSHSQIMHFAFTYASVFITHPRLFKELLQRLLELKGGARFKDLSKIIWACGTLQTTGKDHMKMISTVVDYVRNNIPREQVLKYPDNLMDFLVGLSYLEIYPLDIIDEHLDQEIVTILLGFGEGRAKFLQLQLLDESLPIECPQFKRRLLSKVERDVVQEKLQNFSVEVDMKLRKPLMPVLEALREMLGVDKVDCDFLLPHFKTADVLVAYDKRKNCFVNPKTSTFGTPGNIEEIVIMLLSKAQTTYDNQPVGMLQCKVRQLRKLGYTVVQINADEALGYTFMDTQTLQEHLMVALSKAIHSSPMLEKQ